MISPPRCAASTSCESGATSIEYAMVAAGIGAAVAGVITALGTTVSETFYDKLGTMF